MTDVQVYRKGYLFPVTGGKFDAKRDSLLIAKGTHFFCLGHLEAVALTEQSSDKRYCQECKKGIKE